MNEHDHDLKLSYEHECFEIWSCDCGHYTIVWKDAEMAKRGHKVEQA